MGKAKEYRMNKEIADKIMNLAIAMKKEQPTLRLGQAFFNALYMNYPIFANTIRETDRDMFFCSEEELPNYIDKLIKG